MNFELWTDGGCAPNPGAGGWGAVILDLDRRVMREIWGGAASTTNNRMECLAMIRGLQALPADASVRVFSDSLIYVRHGQSCAAGTLRRKKNTKNWELLEQLRAEVEMRRCSFEWIKGHSGNRFNERADQLAARGRAQYGRGAHEREEGETSFAARSNRDASMGARA